MMNLNFSHFPELATQRLKLRQLKGADINEFYILKSDERLLKGYHGTRKTFEEARRFLGRLNDEIKMGESITWGIALKTENKLIGSISFWNICVEQCKAEIGYELVHEWHGQGIMCEALKAVAMYGFKTIGIKRIEALPYSANIASVRLLEKCGFSRIKEFLQAGAEGEAMKQSEFILTPDKA